MKKHYTMTSKLIKGLTLTLFATLIIAFIGYRSGWFKDNSEPNLSSNNDKASQEMIDTIEDKDSIKKVEMMSSSKVLILREHSVSIEDSTAKELDSVYNPEPLIYGSKSGIILKPEYFHKKDIDTLKDQ